MWFIRERKQNSAKKVFQLFRRHRGFSDLLSYVMALDDCTVLHQDGALSRYFRYIAPDLESSTDQDLDFHASTWSQVFQFLGDGWMVETNVLSQPFHQAQSAREFPERVSALIDDERRLQYQGQHYFKTTYYLSITWKPAQIIASKLRRFALEGDIKEKDGLDECEMYFNKAVNEAIGFLKRSLISIETLEGNELTSFLYQCITGLHQNLVKPYEAAMLNTYLSAQDFIGGFSPQMGKKNIQVLAIDDLPAYSYPCLLDELSFFPIEYRWSTRFMSLSPMTAKSYLKRYERNWSSKAIGIMGVIRESMGLTPKRDEDAQATADQLKAAQTESSSGQVGYGFYNSTLVLMHEDREFLSKMSEAIQSKIQQLDFRVRAESVNACEAYLGSIPGHGDYNLRKLMVDTNFVGHAFPTSSIYQGELKAPCHLTGYHHQAPLLLTATRGSRPFCLNVHVGDVGHTAILGPTGQGKSTLTALLMMSHRQYSGSRIIVLDKDYSNRLPIKALDGDYFDVGKAECEWGVLARVEKDRPDQIHKAVEWLSACVSAQGIDATPSRQKALQEAVHRLSDEAPHYKNLNHLSVQEPELRQALESFNSGVFKQLLNGTTPLLSQSDVMGFEMSSLVKTNTNERDLGIPVIKALFNELDELFQDKRPTLLILEEAWLYLRHALFREKLTDWFKTLRKANVAVIFISQDLDDIVKSDAASTIQTSCMTRIFLPNRSAKEPTIASQYQAFGLNDRQIEIIQQAMSKQDYYYQSPLGNRLFRLDLQPLAKAFLCVSDREDLMQFEKLYDRENPEWILAWLSYKNLSEWHDFAKQHYFPGAVVNE